MFERVDSIHSNSEKTSFVLWNSYRIIFQIDMPKFAVNSPCPCKSGKKYKKCCALKSNKDVFDCEKCGFNRTEEMCKVCDDILEYSRLRTLYNMHVGNLICQKYGKDADKVKKLVFGRLNISSKISLNCEICKKLIEREGNRKSPFVILKSPEGRDRILCYHCGKSEL